ARLLRRAGRRRRSGPPSSSLSHRRSIDRRRSGLRPRHPACSATPTRLPPFPLRRGAANHRFRIKSQTANRREHARMDPDQSASNTGNRRPIAARGNVLVQRFSAWLARTGVSPNLISVASIAFAALGAWALLELESPWGAWLCAIAIVLRLLCNLFDGLVAVEHARKTPTGVLYNEVPDRVADSLFL